MSISIHHIEQSRLAGVDFNNLPFGKICSDHMFVMDYEDGAWQEGKIVPLSNFSIHPANLTLHYGQSIFEGMKASADKDGTPLLFRLDKHVERINASADRMCMPHVPGDIFTAAIETLVDLDKGWIPPTDGSALYIRPYMFATDEFIGVRPSETYKFVIFTCPVGPYYAKPVSLLAADEFVRACDGGVGEAKTAGNYAASLYPAKAAKEKGYDQVMWMDPVEFKYIQEVGTMNIFFIMDGKAYTPNLNGSILKGITRDSVITIMQDRGIEVVEAPLSKEQVIEAYEAGTLQEVFGTGTAAVVSYVNKIAFGDKILDIDPESYEVGPYLKSYIERLRSGEQEDKFGWIQKVNQLQLAE